MDGKPYRRCRSCGVIAWGAGDLKHKENCDIAAALAAPGPDAGGKWLNEGERVRVGDALKRLLAVAEHRTTDDSIPKTTAFEDGDAALALLSPGGGTK